MVYEQKFVKMAFHQEFLVCYLSEGRNLLLNTRNNSGDSPSLGTSFPTVWNGSKRSGNFSRVANSGLARVSVASPSQIGRMSLGDSYVTRHGCKSVVSHHKSVGGRSQVYHDGRTLVGGYCGSSFMPINIRLTCKGCHKSLS